MNNQNFIKQASIWGQVFEIAVQRGILAYLLQKNILAENHTQLKPWREVKIYDLQKELTQILGETYEIKTKDENLETWIKEYYRHLLVLGYGLGWSTLRECLKPYLKKQRHKPLQLQAIWAPLTLPGREDPRNIEREKTTNDFSLAFGLSDFYDLSIVGHGEPARADFLLWLSPQINPNQSKALTDLILCFEFSFNNPAKLEDFTLESSHAKEISRYARYLESRGCFSRICAEVKDDHLTLHSKLKDYLSVFSGQDKPLYKLCQASSYLERLVKLLRAKKRLVNSCETRAVAITSNGIESLGAHFSGLEKEPDVKVDLMRSIGLIYRKRKKANEENLNTFNQQEIKGVFNKLLISLPANFKNQVKKLEEEPIENELNLLFTEEVKDYYQPQQEILCSELLKNIEETEELKQFFNNKIPNWFAEKNTSKASAIPLREAHADVVNLGLEAAQKGRLNVIALEGNPGIGKTTAVVSFLQQQETGFLFLYVSPRVVINRNVTTDLARDKNNQKTGVLTLTTNSRLIASAPKWYKEQNSSDKTKTVDSAVVIDGAINFTEPQSSIIFVTPEQEKEIDDNITISRRNKFAINEREDYSKKKTTPGVLRTLATSARYVLEANPHINRIVLTGAIQGFRNLQTSTTIDGLSNLFSKNVDKTPGIKEREQFAQKIPTIIAMVDELTGDGAGALFLNKLAQWLEQQFIKPFPNNSSPFKVVLIIADASLTNEIVLDNFINSGEKAPDKVLISESRGEQPFRVTGTLVTINSKKYPTLHVMTNSYPASKLNIDYSMRLSVLKPELDKDGKPQSILQAIRQQSGDTLLKNSYAEIERALKENAQQIIFFAQDKAFLRELKQKLTQDETDLLSSADVEILDQSVPSHIRQELVNEPKRAKVKVFLMTSSGARGVSFPKADWIITSFPRFNVESSLMEIAQLIYRGRGSYMDPITNKLINGDAIPRRLVMLINDFVIKEEETEFERQWLKQSSDLLTLLVMLRATIYTRIKGDAGLRKKRIAFVPVGSIGDQELTSLMSDDVKNFLVEANVCIQDTNYTQEQKGKVGEAKKLVEKLFSDFELRSLSSEKDMISYTDNAILEKLVKAIYYPDNLLLPNLKDENLQIPEYITCLGPFWLEDWGERKTEEQFRFQQSPSEYQQNIRKLLGLFKGIEEDKKLPAKLRNPAKDLKKMIDKDTKETPREYSIFQNLNTENLLIAIPLDYTQFWMRNVEDKSQLQHLEEPETWRNSLGRTLNAQRSAIPVIPHYRSSPWAAVVGKKTLSQLEMIFDNRYFMISNELNLLNFIVLEDE